MTDHTPPPDGDAAQRDAERLARLRGFYKGCAETDDNQPVGIGHPTFLLRLLDERDAALSALERELREARDTLDWVRDIKNRVVGERDAARAAMKLSEDAARAELREARTEAVAWKDTAYGYKEQLCAARAECERLRWLVRTAITAIDHLTVADGGKVCWGEVANIGSMLERDFSAPRPTAAASGEAPQKLTYAEICEHVIGGHKRMKEQEASPRTAAASGEAPDLDPVHEYMEDMAAPASPPAPADLVERACSMVENYLVDVGGPRLSDATHYERELIDEIAAALAAERAEASRRERERLKTPTQTMREAGMRALLPPSMDFADEVYRVMTDAWPALADQPQPDEPSR